MKKLGYFFFCFLPVLASIGLQFAATFPVLGITAMQYAFSNLLSGQKMPYSEFAMYLTSVSVSQTFLMTVSIVYASFGILIFGFWYYRQFHGSLRFPMQKFTKPGLILGLILLIPALQVISSVLTTFSAAIFPGAMDFYESLMESTGFTNSPSILLILYAVFLGPIAEELTFRGVTLSSAKKALPFWAANLFQAILFGIFHMNLIQGIYAFFIGLCLGFVCEKCGSIWLSVFLHILFNAWGTFAPAEIYSIPLFILFILLGILGMYLFHKNTSVRSVKNFADISDI